MAEEVLYVVSAERAADAPTMMAVPYCPDMQLCNYLRRVLAPRLAHRTAHNGESVFDTFLSRDNTTGQRVVFNRENLSCGAAWNQGILARQSEWTIVMNNDLVVTEGFAQGLIDFALRRGLLMASPAMVEGELDYDFKGFAREASRKMGQASRLGS